MGASPTIHVCIPCTFSAHRGLKRASVPLELELNSCKVPYWCWTLSPSPLQKHQVLLTTEPFFQPYICLILYSAESVLFKTTPHSGT